MASYLWGTASWVAQSLGLSQQPTQAQTVPRVRVGGEGSRLEGDDDHYVIVNDPGELGVTESELTAAIIPIERDGSCLYGSVRAFLERNWNALKGQKILGERVLNELPSLKELRNLVACYIESQFPVLLVETESSAYVDKPALLKHLDETIQDHDEQVRRDLKQQLESMNALARQKLSQSEREGLQESHQRVQLEAIENQFGEGAKGYTAYTKKVREDMHFHGGYAEVYALSQIFGFKIKVLTESTKEQLQSGEDYGRVVSLIVEPTPKATCPLICYFLFNPDARHFDLLDYTGP